jgi:hypothetical protein
MEEITVNIANYIVENDLKSKDVFDIFNNWSSEKGFIIKNTKDLLWIISYIKLLQSMDYDFIKESLQIAS